MKAIWVIENVKKDNSFYDEFTLVMLFASVTLWKRYHPNHTTILYCDKQTLDVLSNLDILSLWDQIKDLSYPEKINREIFWSSCKTKIISEATEPIIVIDHDFLISTNIDEYLKDEVLYTHEEQAYPWYPHKNDKYCAQLPYPAPNEVDLAANVSGVTALATSVPTKVSSAVAISIIPFTVALASGSSPVFVPVDVTSASIRPFNTLP